MLDLAVKAVCLVLIICIGYVLKRKAVFKSEDAKVISKLILNLTLPAALINSFRAFTWCTAKSAAVVRRLTGR